METSKQVLVGALVINNIIIGIICETKVATGISYKEMEVYFNKTNEDHKSYLNML